MVLKKGFFMDNNISQDDFLGGKIKIYQPLKGYRGGIDPVLLASSVAPKPNANILEVGSGTGIATLCLASRIDALSITGIEKQKELYELAIKSAEFNNLESKVKFINQDITLIKNEIKKASFDYVITNPPYHFANYPSPNNSIATANAETTANLEFWLKFCIKMLKHKGTFIMIFNAERIDEIMKHLYGKLGGITIAPIWSKQGQDAKRIIIKGRKGIKSPTAIEAGLVLHNETGEFTSKANDILRNGLGFI